MVKYESITFPLIRNPAKNVYAGMKPDPESAFELLVDVRIMVVNELGRR